MHPYFTFKDLVTFFFFFLVLSIMVFYYPNFLGHSDNYIPANPMQTPASIVPEWYKIDAMLKSNLKNNKLYCMLETPKALSTIKLQYRL